ncbi:dTDP-4-dehydrorhamnose reductase [Aliifodinibius salicampi]|uniref:dTDP-4-dehydrorhamnose reductase n=1 Tax=Fodinibius salicampi TaxID=1920655 RepID=A0ABT3PXQ6_9BACT|nr:dTDP-4-dehydrorhamnose reductase [Fodinibius salicampi]MCW9712632.1 dTDP-4-dehydrorhamnose reductase [Fodinibius salicampi]
MKDLILLGASGQLGQEWQQILDKEDFSQFNIAAYDSDQLDLTDKHKLAEVLQERNPDVVVNCAAYTKVDESEKHIKQAETVNVKAVAELARLSEELNFKLLHYSTDYIFPGGEEDKQRFPKGYTEDHPADPINKYGETKWKGEQAIRDNTDNYLIIRVSWLCGQFGSNFVKTMLKLGKERSTLQVVDDQWGSPTFTTNVVENCINLLYREVKGTYHLTSEGLITWYEFARAIFDKAGVEVKVEPVSSDQFETMADRPHYSKLCTDKIEAVPGSNVINWNQGLDNLLSQLDSLSRL